MPPQPTNFFRSLAGVPVHYDRLRPEDYGTEGIPYDFHTPADFQALLDACFEDLWRICPLGRARLIISAGTYSNRPSQHGTGRAMDVDGIFWPEKRFITKSFPSDKPFYLGVEAVFRRHFDFVLTYLYNEDHHDHFHLDRAGRLGLGRTRSKTLFVQAMSRYVFDLTVDVDGQWGEETEIGLETMRELVGIEGNLDDLDTWNEFLERIAVKAFDVAHEDRAEALQPFRELAGILDSELAQQPTRKVALALVDKLQLRLLKHEAALAVPSGKFLELGIAEERPQGRGRRRNGDAQPTKDGRLLARPFLAPGPVDGMELDRDASSGWHSRFGGQEWRFDNRGVYLRSFANGMQPLRTPGQPVTCRAIWSLYADEIRRASDRHGIPAELIVMTIATESAYWRRYDFTGPETFFWEPNVLVTDAPGPDYRGDYSAGPMQTLATTARWVIRQMHLDYQPFEVAPAIHPKPEPAPAELPLYDPAINIDIGTAEIKTRLATSAVDPILVAACYNAGGLYSSTTNDWHLRSTNDHLDRAAKWFGDACAVISGNGDARNGLIERLNGAAVTDPAILAQRILGNSAITLATTHSSGNVDNANARQNMVDTAAGLPARRSSYDNAPGGTTPLRPSLLGGLLALAEHFSFSISELAGGSHSPNSRHYVGVAADIHVINGRHVSVSHPDVHRFTDMCADLGATEIRSPGDPGHSTHVHVAWPRPV